MLLLLVHEHVRVISIRVAAKFTKMNVLFRVNRRFVIFQRSGIFECFVAKSAEKIGFLLVNFNLVSSFSTRGFRYFSAVLAAVDLSFRIVIFHVSFERNKIS
jgi:hypothetical protein